MATRLNTAPLMSLILCVILTLVFTVLIITTSSDVRRLRDGDPDRPNGPSVGSLRAEVRKKQTQIENLQRTIDADREALYQLDLQGNVRRLFYENGHLMGGVATPNAARGVVGLPGEEHEVPFKASTWDLLRDLMQLDAQHLDKVRTEAEGPDRQEFPSIDEAIHQRQDQLKQALQAIQAQEQAWTADKERLTAKRDELSQKRNHIDQQRRTDASERLTRINDLEDKIRELLALDLKWMVDRDKTSGKIVGLAGLQPVGRVLQLDVQGGKVVIDRGAHDKVFPGLLFEVFNYDRGAYVNKGRVEVIEVQQGIAVCRILEQTMPIRDPISRQDYIGNPVFSTGKPRVFVVSGDFKRYNKEDLEGFIRRTGAVVWPRLAPGADYLVAGDRSEPAQAEARQYQILAMHEDDLLRYVQTTFPPTAGDATSTSTPPIVPVTPPAPAAAAPAGDAAAPAAGAAPAAP